MRKINHKIKTQVLIISLLLIIGLVVSLCAYMVIFQKKTAYAATQNVEEEYETIEKTFIDINEILEKNTQNKKKEEIVKKEIDLEYITKYQNNPELPSGMIQVVQEGIDGKQEEITKKYMKEINLLRKK